jgi:hypothetical protein
MVIKDVGFQALLRLFFGLMPTARQGGSECDAGVDAVRGGTDDCPTQAQRVHRHSPTTFSYREPRGLPEDATRQLRMAEFGLADIRPTAMAEWYDAYKD